MTLFHDATYATICSADDRARLADDVANIILLHFPPTEAGKIAQVRVTQAALDDAPESRSQHIIRGAAMAIVDIATPRTNTSK